MDINFAGYQLTDVFLIKDVKRSILPPRTNYSISIPSKNGEYYTGFKYNPRVIEVEIIVISNDLNSQIRNLSWMLDLPNPSPLIISDEPDKQYYAVLDGDTSFESVLQVGTGTLKFLCLDPFAYSTTDLTFEADSGGKILLMNGGTAECEPIFSLEFFDSATFLALVSPQGVVQIGSPQEVDVTHYPASEVLVNDGMSATTNWITNSASSKIRTPLAVKQGSVFSNNANIRANSYGTDISGKWFGPIISHDLGVTADGTSSAQYFETSMSFKFMSDNWFSSKPEQKQVGRLEYNILDETGNFLCGFTIRDSFEGYQWNIPEFWVGTQQVWKDEPAIPPSTKITQYDKKTKKNVTKTIAPVNIGKWNDFYGKIIIRRAGNTFYFELQKLDQTTQKILSRTSKTWYDTGEIYTNMKAKSINCWFGKYSTSPFVGLNYIDQVYFKKNNVEDWHRVPNIFNAGDVVTVDCQSSQVYLNGELFMQKLDVGSTFFSLLEGESEIQLLHNSATQPTMTATITERFL